MQIGTQRCSGDPSKIAVAPVFSPRARAGPLRKFNDALACRKEAPANGKALGTFNHANFHDRIKNAAAARTALVEKLKARPSPEKTNIASGIK